MSDDYCFDCVYSSNADNMQACVWDSGLKSRQTKCDRYKRSWQKTLTPILFIIMLFLLIVRIFLLAIWGI